MASVKISKTLSPRFTSFLKLSFYPTESLYTLTFILPFRIR